MDAQRPSGGSTVGTDHVELLRRWVLGLLVLGLVGTVPELVLLSHYEQRMQLVHGQPETDRLKQYVFIPPS